MLGRAMKRRKGVRGKAKAMTVPAMIGGLERVYSCMNGDPVMAGPALHVLHALHELSLLRHMAQRVVLEEPGREDGRDGGDSSDSASIILPLAWAHLHSPLKH